MNDLQSLARRLMTLDDRIVACMKCGFCQQVCPMFGATMMEADVARGKLALVSNLAHEMIRDPRAVADKLGRCLLCGSCEAACPSGVKIMEVFLAARELVYEYIGLSPVKKVIFRGLLTVRPCSTSPCAWALPPRPSYSKKAGTPRTPSAPPCSTSCWATGTYAKWRPGPCMPLRPCG